MTPKGLGEATANQLTDQLDLTLAAVRQRLALSAARDSTPIGTSKQARPNEALVPPRYPTAVSLKRTSRSNSRIAGSNSSTIEPGPDRS